MLTPEEDQQIRQILDATGVYRDAINKLTQPEAAHATPTQKAGAVSGADTFMLGGEACAIGIRPEWSAESFREGDRHEQ